MNNLQIERPAFTITGTGYDNLAPTSTIAVCKDKDDRESLVNFILNNRELFESKFYCIDVYDVYGSHVEHHVVATAKTLKAIKGNYVINSCIVLDCIVYAMHSGRLIKSQVHHTDTALAVAHHFINLGWDVEVVRADNCYTLFDSDYDFIQEMNDGSLKALFIVGTR